jgi:hypothetical protein
MEKAHNSFAKNGCKMKNPHCKQWGSYTLRGVERLACVWQQAG